MGSKILIVIALTLVVIFLKSIFVMLLWNWLCPVIFGLPTINFLQAFGLGLLINLLFKFEVTNEKE